MTANCPTFEQPFAPMRRGFCAATERRHPNFTFSVFPPIDARRANRYPLRFNVFHQKCDGGGIWQGSARLGLVPWPDVTRRVLGPPSAPPRHVQLRRWSIARTERFFRKARG